MSTFRNIIARRRPSGPAPRPVSDPAKLGPDPDDAAMDMAAEPVSRPAQPKSYYDAEKAGFSMDIPRWEPEKPLRTMGEAPAKGPAEPAPAKAPAQARPETGKDTPRRKIWSLDGDKPGKETPVDGLSAQAAEAARPAPQTAPAAAAPEPAPVPLQTVAPATPAVAAGGRVKSTRVKTRLLGFHSDDLMPDAFAADRAPTALQAAQCPIGWLVVVEGPGRGASFAISAGLSSIGRGADQTIALDFGDDSVSRDNHASVAYDEEENRVLVGHGGKSNLVRLNGKPLLSTEELSNGDQIRVGKTTLRFVELCGADFTWTEAGDGAQDDA